MTKSDFLALLGRAYNFPDYYGQNLDSAEEILDDLREAHPEGELSLEPLIRALLSEATAEEQTQVWDLLQDHFPVE